MHVQRLFCTIGSTQTLSTAISASISPRSIVELMIRWEIRRMSVSVSMTIGVCCNLHPLKTHIKQKTR